MIESGSCVPGIDASSFGLPAGTALRYEPPAAALSPFFSDYAVLDSDRSIFDGPDSWLLPGGAQIWIVLTEGPISVTVRNRHYAELGAAVLYGPTSRAMPVTSNGGVSIVIDLTPLGWARWFDMAAEDCRDRITPLDQVWPADRVSDLIARLHASDRGPGVKAILNDIFLSCLPPAHPSEARIARVMAALLDPAITGSAHLAAGIGLGSQTILRLCRRYFGFGPKMLIRRHRFLHAFVEMILAEAAPAASLPLVEYPGIPHFLRDGTDFLVMTPRRFAAMPMPYLRAALRARRQVIGSAWPLLDAAPLAEVGSR